MARVAEARTAQLAEPRVMPKSHWRLSRNDGDPSGRVSGHAEPTYEDNRAMVYIMVCVA